MLGCATRQRQALVTSERDRVQVAQTLISLQIRGTGRETMGRRGSSPRRKFDFSVNRGRAVMYGALMGWR